MQVHRQGDAQRLSLRSLYQAAGERENENGTGRTGGVILINMMNCDCMEYMKGVKDNSFDFTLTDIPYDVVNRTSNGLRSLDSRNCLGVCMENINLTVEESYTDEDLKYLQEIFQNPEMTKEDIVMAYENNEIVRIADTKDYQYAYEDFAQFEDGFEKECRNELSFEQFMTELKKGYGKSGCVQVARLFELSNGIWYDNEYC